MDNTLYHRVSFLWFLGLVLSVVMQILLVIITHELEQPEVKATKLSSAEVNESADHYFYAFICVPVTTIN